VTETLVADAARDLRVTETLVADTALGSVPSDWDADRAVTALYTTHYRSLVRLAQLLVRDDDTAQEVVQDSFVAMHGAWRRLQDSGKALSYLRQSVVNRSRFVLSRRIAADWTAPKPPPDGPSAERGALTLLDRSVVVSALRELPPRQREALVLRYYGDLSEAQIASTMGISKGAVKTHTARAMSALRSALEVGEAGSASTETGSEHGKRQDRAPNATQAEAELPAGPEPGPTRAKADPGHREHQDPAALVATDAVAATPDGLKRIREKIAHEPARDRLRAGQAVWLWSSATGFKTGLPVLRPLRAALELVLLPRGRVPKFLNWRWWLILLASKSAFEGLSASHQELLAEAWRELEQDISLFYTELGPPPGFGTGGDDD
jgi:RNA polymerase sigma-70 factor (sigma-E family)